MNSKLILSTFHIFFIIFEVTKVDAFDCPEKFGHYPDSTDCSKYYVCNHGRNSMQQCEDGLFYNAGLKTCDWPRNVQCDKGGRRVNTRRNPDLKKTSYRRHKSEFEETNQLSPHTNSEEVNNYENPPNEHNSDEYRPIENNGLNGRPPVSKEPKPSPHKWHQNFSPKFTPNTQNRGPVDYNRSPKVKPLVAPPTVATTENPPEEYEEDDEYELPDYYDYNDEALVRNVRKPVKEAETPRTNVPEPKQKPPSVKRIGWLPENPNSDHLNDYHWSPKDAVNYSKDKPRIPDEAYIKMKDFRNVEKQLAEDNSPNEGPPPEEGEEYEDYYEDEDQPEDDDDYHHHEEEEAPATNENEAPEQPEHPPSEKDRSSKEVRYDDDEEVRQQPRLQPPPNLARPQTRQRVPVPPPNYSAIARQPPSPHSTHNPPPNSGGGIQFERMKPAVNQPDEISGLRSVANKYESVPKLSSALTSAKMSDHSNKPVIKTNIHYKNINSPYLRPVLDQTRSDSPDSSNYNKGRLINSVPRNDVSPKKRVVVRKVVKQNREPQKIAADSIDPVTPSIYQLLDDYRKELPDALLKHKQKAQEFRDTIIDNYMHNDKPNYILNDKDFDGHKSYTIPTVSGEGDDNFSDNIRSFDNDFTTTTTQSSAQYNEIRHNILGSDRNLIQSSQSIYNQTTIKPFIKPIIEKSGNNFMNTDAIVKQQRAQHYSVSPLTTVSPPVEKITKKPLNFSTLPFTNYKPPPKRTTQAVPMRFGFKQYAIKTTTSTTTTPRPTPKPTSKPKSIRIKIPRATQQPAPRPDPLPPPQLIPVVKPQKAKKRTEWYRAVNYEPKPSTTDLSHTKANKCDPMYCRLPGCRCGGIDIPGELHPKQTPQIVLLTFDDSVNDLNWDIYDELFNSGRNNPNGCPILATFYVSHEWTDYAQVQTLYSRGHEIASHSITHSFGEKFSKDLWLKEIAGQREILSRYGGVKESDVRGMRAPFLQTGGNTMFEMLHDANFTYDSSLPIYEINPPYYPYTFDYAINHECMIPPCPTKSFPGLWEVGMVMWEDLRDGRCSMADACFNPKDEQGVYEMVKKNFDRHYTTNRAPFGIYFHSRWFLTDINRKGFMKFMDEIMGLKDVYFVTNWQMIQWMQSPTPLNKIANFAPWKCDYRDRPHECDQPNQCKAKFRSETRVFKTCQPCPKTYPWRGNNGLKHNN